MISSFAFPAPGPASIHQDEIRAKKFQAESLELSPRALLRRQDLETGRPPAGLDRLDELAREALAPHLARQARMVVVDGHELDGHTARALLEDREPHVRLSVVR